MTHLLMINYTGGSKEGTTGVPHYTDHELLFTSLPSQLKILGSTPKQQHKLVLKKNLKYSTILDSPVKLLKGEA